MEQNPLSVVQKRNCNNQQMKQTIFIDMDGVVADFIKAIEAIEPNILNPKFYPTDHAIGQKIDALCVLPENRRIFLDLDPMPFAVEAVDLIFKMEDYDAYFLSTPMWHLPESFTDKRLWLERHFGEQATKRLILSHRKDLAKGQYLIDDRLVNGVENFEGKHIHFGSAEFPGWEEVITYLFEK